MERDAVLQADGGLYGKKGAAYKRVRCMWDRIHLLFLRLGNGKEEFLNQVMIS